MASSDDFREKLKAGNITEALTLALTEAATLTITTQVLSGTEDLGENQAKPGYRLQTQINAIEGAIENEIGEQFLGNGPYRELLQFHQDQVAQSNLMIQNNLQSLQKLFEVLIALRHPSIPQTITEPLLLEDKEQLLPSSSSVAPGLVIEPQKSVAQEIPLTLDTSVADIPSGGWYIEDPESFTEEIPLTPDTSVADIPSGWTLDHPESLTEEIPLITDTPVADIPSGWYIEEPESFTEEITPIPDTPVADIPSGWYIDEPESFTEEISPTPDTPVADIPAGGWYIEEPESFTEEIPLIPDTPVADIPAEWTLDHPESFTEEIAPTPPTPINDIGAGGWAIDSQEFVVEEDVTPEATPLNRQDILDRQREEDDAALDLLISLPAPQLPSEEGLDIQLEDGEWGEFLDEENLQVESEESDLEERDWAILSQDWGDLDLEEVDAPPVSSGLNIEALDFQIEPESPQIEFTQDHPISRLESLELAASQEEEEEEWDDWIVDEPQIQRSSPLDLQESHEWGDLMTDFDPFAEAPSIEELPANVDIGEDWDEFAVDELEPYSETLDVDSGFDLSELLEDITPPPSSLYGSEDIDFRQNPENDPIEKLDSFSSMSDRDPEVSSDMMDIFFEESQSRANRQGGGKRDDMSMGNRQESIFDDMSFEEFSVSMDDSEIELGAEDFSPLSDTEDDEEDWGEDINEIGKREPPPSPPSYFFKPKK